MVGYGRTYHSTILYLNDQLGRTSTTTRVESRSPMIGGRMEMIKSSKVCKRWKVYKKYFWMKLILDKKSVWWRKCSPAGTPGQGGASQGFLACTSGRTWIKKSGARSNLSPGCIVCRPIFRVRWNTYGWLGEPGHGTERGGFKWKEQMGQNKECIWNSPVLASYWSFNVGYVSELKQGPACVSWNTPLMAVL